MERSRKHTTRILLQSMSVFYIEPQEHYFYEVKWSKDIANVFIRVLMDDVKMGDWIVSGDNLVSLQGAQDFVNVMMDKEFTWDDAYDRAQEMLHRAQVYSRR